MSKPTRIDSDGNKYWEVNGKYHKTNGPAIDRTDGSKSWYVDGKYVRTEYHGVNGKLHRTNGPAVEHSSGLKEWFVDGKRHRTDGPAMEYANGSKCWWVGGKQLSEEEFNTMNQTDKPTRIDNEGNKFWEVNGKPHRTNGPARERADGSKWWCVNGKLHRTDGPAIEFSDGSKQWWVNDRLHRADGPAVERSNGSKSWWVDGKQLSEEEFNTMNQTDKPTRMENVIQRLSDGRWLMDGKQLSEEEMGLDTEEFETAEEALKDAMQAHYGEVAETVARKKATAEINSAAMTPGMLVYHAFTNRPCILIEKAKDGWVVELENGERENISDAMLRITDPGILASFWSYLTNRTERNNENNPIETIFNYIILTIIGLQIINIILLAVVG